MGVNNGILLGHKGDCNYVFCGKWLESENIVLSRIRWTQENKPPFLSPVECRGEMHRSRLYEQLLARGRGLGEGGYSGNNIFKMKYILCIYERVTIKSIILCK